MSRENVEVVRRVSAAFQRGDLDAVFREVDPAVEWDFTRTDTWLEEQVYRGFDEITDFFRRWTDGWDDWHFEIQRVVDAGDRVVAVIHDEAHGKSTGLKVEREFAQVWSINSEGKVTRIDLYDRVPEALAAVGLSE